MIGLQSPTLIVSWITFSTRNKGSILENATDFEFLAWVVRAGLLTCADLLEQCKRLGIARNIASAWAYSYAARERDLVGLYQDYGRLDPEVKRFWIADCRAQYDAILASERLPYDFDLLYDFKTIHQLLNHLSGKERCATSATDAELIDLMRAHNMTVSQSR
jgi:hypothetical protein